MISAKQEQKFFDVSSTYVQLDRAGLITALSIPALGGGSQNRIGDRLYHKYVDLRINAYLSQGATAAPQHAFRCIVFKYLEDDTAGAPTLGSILQATGGVGDYRAVVSAYNWDAYKQKDFVILYDRLFSIGNAGSGVAMRKRIRVRGTADFSGAAITGVGIVYVLFVADDLTGAHAPAVQLQYYARSVYTDA